MDDLLDSTEKNGFPITYDELVECVETNDKQRFAFAFNSRDTDDKNL